MCIQCGSCLESRKPQDSGSYAQAGFCRMSRSLHEEGEERDSRQREYGVGRGKRKAQSQLSNLEDQLSHPDSGLMIERHQGFQAGCGMGSYILLEEPSLWPESG